MGEEFAHLLNHSPYRQVVEEMYRIAGLDLKADLATLTADADIAADPDALESLTETSVPTGRLDVPVLTMHTTGDALVPVQHEREYGDLVRKSGDASMLRQAYVERAGHCTFTDAELVAGLEALQERVETGLWQNLAQPKQLNQRARALGLGEAAFVNFLPDRLSGDPGEFDPGRNQ
jgi:pimeloyl-ACP methyl ester carboxylesterase